MRLSDGGISIWCGTPDAPAPSGLIGSWEDTSVSVGIEPPDPHGNITVLYRINHGPPQTAIAQRTHGHSNKEFFRAHLADIKGGDEVEYIPIYRSNGHQIPSNQDAERHVLSFILEPRHGGQLKQ